MSSIFTRVRLSELPGEVIYQDADVFILLSIAPHNPGHCLVIPVEEVVDFVSLPAPLLHRLTDVAQQMMRVTKTVYSAPRAALVVDGQEIPHVHIHVFSLFKEGDLDASQSHVASPEELAKEAHRLRSYLVEHPIQ